MYIYNVWIIHEGSYDIVGCHGIKSTNPNLGDVIYYGVWFMWYIARLVEPKPSCKVECTRFVNERWVNVCKGIRTLAGFY